MAYITKMTTYAVPFEKSTNDRIVEDIDNKIKKFEIAEFEFHENKFSHDFTSSTKTSFTVSGKRANYIRIESKLFENTLVSYWFLTDIISIPSSKATTYDATLDSFATFGKSVLNELKGKDILVDRIHGERYIVDEVNKKAKINPEHPSLFNSDFKINNVLGSKPHFSGKNTPKFIEYEYRNIPVGAGDYNNQGNAKFKHYSTPIDGTENGTGRRGFLYAILSGPSFRTWLTTTYPVLGVDDKSWNYYFKLIPNNTNIGDFYILPINPIGLFTRRLGLGGEITGQNTLEFMEQLPKDIVLNIISTPHALKPKPIKNSEFNGMDTSKFYDKDWTATTPLQTDGFGFNAGANKNLLLFDFVVIPTWDFNNEDLNVLLPTDYELPTARELDLNNKYDEKDIEIGINHPDISNVQYIVEDEKINIDMPNLIKATGKITNKVIVTPQGAINNVLLSPNQEHKYISNNMISFFTSQGSTYLQQNSNSIEAQKKLVALQQEMNFKQTQIQQTANHGGGIVGALLGLINPATYVTDGLLKGANNINKKITAAKKQQIQASIDDAEATPAIVNMGKEGAVAYLSDEINKFDYGVKYVIPNDIILNKVIDFYKRHGYNTKTIINFSEDTWKNRERYNFLKINSAEEYLTTKGDIDIDVIEDITKDLNTGIRIFHTDDFDVTARNVENTIKKYIN